MGCTSHCIGHSRKPHTSGTHSSTTRTEVFHTHSNASFSTHAASQFSLAHRSSPSRAVNAAISTSTHLQRKTSVIEGGGSGELDAHPKATSGVGE
ncbi:hypothetical protein C0989_009584 [Termitomyces sp. Mn162]|nr:hypothetical protein C0989_009584 [Termitomyces sp. Mn162]